VLSVTSPRWVFTRLSSARLHSRQLDPLVAARALQRARRVQSNSALKGLRDINRILGMDELARKTSCRDACAQDQRFLSQPSTLPRFTGTPGKIVPLADTSKGSDGLSMASAITFRAGLHMVRAIEEVFEKAKTLQ